MTHDSEPDPKKIISIEEVREEARQRQLAWGRTALPDDDDGFEPPEPSPPGLWDRVGDVHPGLTYSLVLILLAIFAVELVTATGRAGAALAGGSLAGPLLSAGASAGSRIAAGEWWRLLSAVLLHANVLHVGSNALALAILGGVAERAYGHARFLVLFVVAGLAGSLVGLASHSSSSVGSIGASGAVFGVGAAVVVAAFRLRGLLAPWRVRALIGATLPLLLSSLAAGFGRPGTDNGAHVGGVLAGVALASFLPFHPRLSERPESRGATLVWRLLGVGAGAILVLCGVVAAWKAFVPAG